MYFISVQKPFFRGKKHTVVVCSCDVYCMGLLDSGKVKPMLFLVYWLLGGTVGPSKCRNKCIGSRVAVHFQTISISYGQIFPGPKEATQRIFPDIAWNMQLDFFFLRAF